VPGPLAVEIGIAALVAAALHALASGRGRAGRPWSARAAVAAGYLACHVATLGLPALPPADALQRLAFLVALMALPLPRAPSRILVAALALFAPLVLVRSGLLARAPALALGGVLCALTALAHALEPRRRHPALSLALAAGGTGALLLWRGGSGLLAELALGLTAALLALWGLRCILGRGTGEGAGDLAVFLVGSFALLGCLHAGLPAGWALLAAGSPVALLAAFPRQRK